MADLLDPGALRDGLEALPGWAGDTTAITRTAALPSFPEAITVVDQVAVAAEAMNHHPDVDIRWRTLTFRCATHSAGGVTALDLELAATINALLTSAGAEDVTDRGGA
jgi:4a-hydroxytetrahydrobiopterin dehydratase